MPLFADAPAITALARFLRNRSQTCMGYRRGFWLRKAPAARPDKPTPFKPEANIQRTRRHTVVN